MNLLTETVKFAGASLCKSAAAVIMGCPYEDSDAFRKGTALAPAAIRAGSYRIGSYQHRLGKDLSDLAFTDWGDVATEGRNQSEIFTDIAQKAEAVMAERKFLFALGGSGAVNYPAIQAAKRVYPELRVLSLDAHTGQEPYIEEMTHGNVFTALFQHHILKPAERCRWGQNVGSREALRGEKPAPVWGSPGVKKGVLGELHRLYRYPVFVTLDIDVMDPPFAPGSGHPVYGGIGTAELFQTVDLLKSLKVVGMSLTEVVPRYDPAEITTLLAATVVRDSLLTFLTKSRKNY